MKIFSIKSGFTLAEVMVCFTVICLIASVALPIINTKKPPKNKILFKRAYLTAERVVYELVNDSDLYPDKDGYAGLDNIEQVTYNGRQYSGASKFGSLFSSKINTVHSEIQEKKYPGGANGPVMMQISMVSISADGVSWSIPQTRFESSATIKVDVDGPDKGLGQLDSGNTCTGNPDVFEIIVDPNGKVHAKGPCARKYLQDVNFNAD